VKSAYNDYQTCQPRIARCKREVVITEHFYNHFVQLVTDFGHHRLAISGGRNRRTLLYWSRIESNCSLVPQSADISSLQHLHCLKKKKALTGWARPNVKPSVTAPRSSDSVFELFNLFLWTPLRFEF